MIATLPIDVLLPLHVVVSLVAIAAGLVAFAAMALGQTAAGRRFVFLATTAATSLTGFLFPFTGVSPAFVFGVVSMAALAGAAATFKARTGTAALAHIMLAGLALYLNLIVLVVQGFQKIPALRALAPNQNEPPFLVAQLIVLAIVVVPGWLASRRAILTAGVRVS